MSQFLAIMCGQRFSLEQYLQTSSNIDIVDVDYDDDDDYDDERLRVSAS